MGTTPPGTANPGPGFILGVNITALGFKPEKGLVKKNHRNKGRNNRGVITIRHRGGGHKKQYRIIDFKRNKHNVPAIVNSIEYDPNRNARIALVHFVDTDDEEDRVSLAPQTPPFATEAPNVDFK